MKQWDALYGLQCLYVRQLIFIAWLRDKIWVEPVYCNKIYCQTGDGD